MKTPLDPSAAWAERYEALRQDVLGGRGLWETPPMGLALWLGSGMAAWMRQWSQLTQWAPLPSGQALLLPSGPRAPWQRQVTMVLAQMTLGHLQTQGSL